MISIKEAARELNTRLAVAAKLLRSVPAKTAEQLAEERVAWGKKLAQLVKKYGWEGLERMTTARLTAELDGRDGIRVQHQKSKPENWIPESADRCVFRWETRRFDRVRVRTCKGKRT